MVLVVRALYNVLFLFVFFFFFQAEDGIRDLTVTGVQTCALPICRGTRTGATRAARGRRASPARGGAAPRCGATGASGGSGTGRSWGCSSAEQFRCALRPQQARHRRAGSGGIALVDLG